MERSEYKEKLEEMQKLINKGNISEALYEADSINWRKVHNISCLTEASEIYEACGKLDEARDLLTLAHEKSPIGRMIIYKLAMISIKMNELEEAENYYNDFVEIAPHDSLKYIIKYRILIAKKASNIELISVLEELKNVEFLEEWSFELAYLYHQTGQINKCIELCDEIILWFGDGPYVERALELKMLYQPLDKAQEDKYRHLQQKKDGITEISANENLNSGEIVAHTIAIPSVELPPERFNTVNLQAEIKKNIDEIMKATEAGAVVDNIDAIKSLVEEIPYLQVKEEEKEEDIKEIDAPEQSINDIFKEYLEEYDGQISLVLPEDNNEDKEEIEGQLTIEDIMEDWSKTQRAAEAALEDAKAIELENAKAKALKEANHVLNRLEEAMPKLDAGVSSKELLKEEYLEKQAEINENQIEETEPEAEEVGLEEAGVEEPVNESSFNIMRVDEAGQESEVGLSIPVVHSQEDQPAEKVSETGVLEKDWANEATITWEPPRLNSEPEKIDFTEASMLIADVNQKLQDEIDRLSMPESNEQVANEELPQIELPQDIQKEIEIAQDIEETAQLQQDSGVEYKQMSPVIPEENVPELAPLELTADEFAEVVDEKVLTKAIKSIPTVKLDNKDKEIFSYFLSVNGMEQVIRQTLTGAQERISNISNSSSGNIVIIGEKGCGKTKLASALIKSMQHHIKKPSGGVGRIDAEKLNHKDIAELFKKIKGGALIIEEAGRLKERTAITLSLLMENDNTGILVVLEDNKKGIDRALMLDSSFAKKFSEKINIPVFTNDELVEFGRTYAMEAGCVFDEMATLALYNEINLIAKYNHVTSVAEVADIIDEVLDRATRKRFGKKYDIDGYLIIKEKDFVEK